MSRLKESCGMAGTWSAMYKDGGRSLSLRTGIGEVIVLPAAGS